MVLKLCLAKEESNIIVKMGTRLYYQCTLRLVGFVQI